MSRATSSAEKGRPHVLPRKMPRGSQSGRASVPSPSDPSKMKTVGERFRRSFQSGGHVPSSVPERQRSAATFVFEGASGRVEPRRAPRRAVRTALPRNMTRGPQSG